MRALVLLLVASCAVTTPRAAPADPANAQAPVGRLAGAPASVRPGVVEYADVPKPGAQPAPAHQHHHAP